MGVTQFLSVFSGKLLAAHDLADFLAVLLRWTGHPPLPFCISHIVRVGSFEQVVWPYASPYVASVANLHTIAQFSAQRQLQY